MTTDSFQKPWNEERFAMLDYCLIQNRWRNIVKDVEAKPRWYISSDHAIVKVKLRVKLSRKYQRKEKGRIKYRNPTKNEKERFNGAFLAESMFWEGATIEEK